MERKEKPPKKLCQNPVDHACRMMQYNFKMRLEPNLFSSHFDTAGTVLASRYAHSLYARMVQEAKTSYTASFTSVTSQNILDYFNIVL